MKGYSEQYGQTFKMDFDAASGQFVSIPITHTFAPKAEPHFIIQKLKEHLKVRKQRKAEHKLKQLLATLGPATRDDVGMTEIFAIVRDL